MFFITTMVHPPDKDLERKSLESITLHGEPIENDTRCIGFYEKMEGVETVLATNNCSIDDKLYNYIVVERINSGVYAPAKAASWYEFHPDENSWLPIDFTAKHISNFAIG